MIPLFKKYPALKESLPYVSLCNLPTPAGKLENLGRQLGHDALYIKQDGYTSSLYGGNKIRKLEFLLGEAVQRGHKKVMTFGFAGSNHATATAIHARSLGIQSISMLVAQENAGYVRRNLLLSGHAGAEIHHYPTRQARNRGEKIQRLMHLLRDRSPLYLIPSGGSSPPGITGFVNAVFELKDQINAGFIPEPDSIYIALGSAGTAVGLVIGIKLAGLKSVIVPVRVIEEEFTPEERIRSAFEDTIAFLHTKDPSIPLLEYSRDDFPVDDRFLGAGYGKFTPECLEAISLLKETEGILLDGTYTGKTTAALLNDARSGKLEKKDVLFWNTLNQHVLSGQIRETDYRTLPVKLHHYFESEIQDNET